MAHTYTSPHSKDVTYYPSPVPRVVPDWIFEFEIGLVGGEREQMIGQLLQEVYAAVRGVSIDWLQWAYDQFLNT
jgi:hypothetical protein